MLPRRLSSLQHPLIKRLVKLRDHRAFRKQEGSALIVGKTVVAEIAKKCPLKTLISTMPLSIPAKIHQIATKEVLQKIIGYKTEDLVAAEVMLPPPRDLIKANLLVVLDQIRDPGNVGTIFRTALALGWEGIFVIEGSADPYNDKALRASRGAPLKLPWREGSWDDIQLLLQSFPRQIFVADPKGISLPTLTFSKPLMLILGHETRGPSDKARFLGRLVSIPMAGEMESLNVAAAASILLYVMNL